MSGRYSENLRAGLIAGIDLASYQLRSTISYLKLNPGVGRLAESYTRMSDPLAG